MKRNFCHGPCYCLLLCMLAQAQAAEVTTILRVPAAGQVKVSALATATMQRDGARVMALLNAEGVLDVNAPGPEGSSALHWAVRYGDLGTARRLATAGANLNLANPYGARPLQLAIENGHAELVGWLLDAGADPAARDLAGEPVLFLAAGLGDTTTIKALLAHGATVDQEDLVYGETALMVAVRNGQYAAAGVLLAAGANVNRQTRNTDVMPGRDRKFVDPSEIPGSLTTGVGLIRGGWPERGVRQPLAGAKTPLHYATRMGDLALTQLLVKAGADLNARDANGMSPLVNAIINTNIVALHPEVQGHLGVASWLVEAGADVNAEDWYGETPLWAAIDMRNLIYRNVSTTDNNVNRNTALALIKQLLERGANPNMRVREYPPSRQFILGVGSVEWADISGQTAFMRAARAGDLTVLHLLLDKGADPNLSTFNGTNALMLAAGVNFAAGETYTEGEAALLETVKLTHALGNDINAVNTLGLQAMHGAANRGANDIVRYLAEHGAELDRADQQGRTPIIWSQGQYLPSRPLIPKPETTALISSYMANKTVQVHP